MDCATIDLVLRQLGSSLPTNVMFVLETSSVGDPVKKKMHTLFSAHRISFYATVINWIGFFFTSRAQPKRVMKKGSRHLEAV